MTQLVAKLAESFGASSAESLRDFRYMFVSARRQPKLNIEYFQRLDRVIDYLDQKGIVAHLMIYVWNKWSASLFELRTS